MQIQRDRDAKRYIRPLSMIKRINRQTPDPSPDSSSVVNPLPVPITREKPVCVPVCEPENEPVREPVSRPVVCDPKPAVSTPESEPLVRRSGRERRDTAIWQHPG